MSTTNLQYKPSELSFSTKGGYYFYESIYNFMNSDSLPENMIESNKLLAQYWAESMGHYLQTATGATVDTGTVSGGTFTGVGTLSSVEDSTDTCYNIMLQYLNMMNTTYQNTFYSQGIVYSIIALFLASTVEFQVTGVTVIPPGVSVPLTGKSESSTWINNCKDMYSSFDVIFEQFNANGASQSAYDSKILQGKYKSYEHSLCDQIGVLITTCFNMNVITTSGQSTLSGSVGTGAMIFS